ncbi:leucine-rich colipase-like protein 1 [Trichosurus vulpecula]|uniref:leucine-rich colipase-like protein 1 n=1 Tax=Trichosurus vulpecula TaxID=9337 RepID=UPI00186B2FF0|nr:leucine-rich colipase-like protein 1 [Trichosurus vulpecula]
MLLTPFTKAGILKLLLTSLLLSQGSMKFHKKIGETCRTHLGCFSECCIRNEKMQKVCTRRMFFMQCNTWKKPNGYSCYDHSECQSNCCVPNSSRTQTFCTPTTVFRQCIPWRKMEGELCSSHKECQSQCCLGRYEDVFHCIPKIGLLTKCFYLMEENFEVDDEVGSINNQENQPGGLPVSTGQQG